MYEGYKVWYADGQVFSGKILWDWENMPERGVLVVLRFLTEIGDHGHPLREIYYSHDHYAYDGENLYCGDAEPDEIRDANDKAIVKYYGLIGDAEFQALIDDIMANERYF